jgi:hypothetical protein
VLGKLHADIFNQQRYLLNGVDLTIKLLRNTDKLVLMGADDTNYKLHIKRASFFVQKIKINASTHRIVRQRPKASYLPY